MAQCFPPLTGLTSTTMRSILEIRPDSLTSAIISGQKTMFKRSIQFTFATLGLLGLLSVTMLWSVGMHAGDNHPCISAAIQNEACPNATTPAAAIFHLNAPQSLVANGLSVWPGLSPLFALAIVILAMRWRSPGHLAGIALRREDSRAISPPTEYQRWLALFEHSPSFSFGRR